MDEIELLNIEIQRLEREVEDLTKELGDSVSKSKVLDAIGGFTEYREPFDDGLYDEFKEICETEEGMHQLMVLTIELVIENLKERINEL